MLAAIPAKQGGSFLWGGGHSPRCARTSQENLPVTHRSVARNISACGNVEQREKRVCPIATNCP